MATGSDKKAKNFGAEWLDALEQKFGEVSEIHKIASDDGPDIHIFFFHNLPEEGSLTAVTCGLSNADHPDWKNGKMELVVSLDTEDIEWGLSLGYFASAFSGKKDFGYGTVFTTDDPITDESDMAGYFIFVPSFLAAQEDLVYELSDRKIYLKGAYPMYAEEMTAFQSLGLVDFFKRLDDLYSVKRQAIRA